MAYSEVLNNITDKEWRSLKLPPVSVVRHDANVQLSGLVVPNFQVAEDTIDDVLGDAVPVHAVGVARQVVNYVVPSLDNEEVGSQCHPECYPGLGGEMFCLVDDISAESEPADLCVVPGVNGDAGSEARDA